MSALLWYKILNPKLISCICKLQALNWTLTSSKKIHTAPCCAGQIIFRSSKKPHLQPLMRISSSHKISTHRSTHRYRKKPTKLYSSAKSACVYLFINFKLFKFQESFNLSKLRESSTAANQPSHSCPPKLSGLNQRGSHKGNLGEVQWSTALVVDS